jgi:hypothetical protein
MNLISPVLKQTLKLASVLANAHEVQSWAEAWFKLDRSQLGMAPMNGDLSAAGIPVEHKLYVARAIPAVEVRPLLFTSLLHQLTGMGEGDWVTALANSPMLLDNYRKLQNLYWLGYILITLLRRASPGFPHDHLLYSRALPSWQESERTCEVPWDDFTDLLQFGKDFSMDRLVPSCTEEVQKEIRNLILVIKADPTWNRLFAASRHVLRNDSLSKDLQERKAVFWSEMNSYYSSQQPFRRSDLRSRVLEIESAVYADLSPKSRSYVRAFLDYERLLSRIYWVLSQALIHRKVSYVSSMNANQIQQVSIERYDYDDGVYPHLEAVTSKEIRTQHPAQLLHITLPETNHMLDGLYQVEVSGFIYSRGNGEARHVFKARQLWSCTLNELTEACKSFKTPLLVGTEADRSANEAVNSMMMSYGDDEQSSTRIQVRQYISSFRLTKHMFFP